MRSPRVCSLIAVGLFAFGCGDPDLNTDLDSEGPPEVNMVTVTHEGAPIVVNGNSFPETPAFCRELNDGGKVNTQICPDEARLGAIAVVNTRPIAWRIRIQFSELLDTDVETLEDRDMDGLNEGHIDTTLPVGLSCDGADIAYDGFYDPSGNDVTVPPGPALVISPTNPFPVVTGSACQVAINDVPTDKDGNALPAEYRGPHGFTLAPFHAAGTSVSEGDTGIDPDEPVAIAFNAPIDPASVAASGITVSDGDGDVTIDVAINMMDPTQLLVLPSAGRFADNTTFTLTLPTSTGVTDALGGAISFECSECPTEAITVSFTTDVSDAMDAGVDATVDAS